MTVRIITGDARIELPKLPAGSVNCCVTSPPYFGLRDYGHGDQIGLETTPEAFVAELVAVFREVRRVLRDDGTCWVNLGDSYGGAAGNTRGDGAGGGKNRGEAMFGDAQSRNKGGRSKDLIGIPWRVAFALQADGWYLRQDIIWHKPNPMPESVTDRCTKSHEYIFLLSKSERYYYDAEAVKEASLGDPAPTWEERKAMGEGNRRGFAQNAPAGCHRVGGGVMRNKRSVWTVATHPYKGAHFATYPPDLIRPCIRAGCPMGGTVLDPFGGSGTTGMVAEEEGRNSILIELNPASVRLAEKRTEQQGLFCGATQPPPHGGNTGEG